MIRDCHGLAVTASSRVVDSTVLCECVNEYQQAVLSYACNWDVCLQALKAGDPDSVLGHLFCADFWWSKGASEKAQLHVELARGIAATMKVTPREELYTEAYSAWLIESNLADAFEAFSSILQMHPQDMFAAKRGSLLAFLFDPSKMVSLLSEPRVSEALSAHPFYLANLSFAYSQNGDSDKALKIGLRAVEVTPDDAWAHHAVAHALHSLGKFDEGLGFMLENAPRWETRMNFLYTHNWFHVALFYLDKLEANSHVLQVFDRHVWIESKQQETDAHEGGMGFSRNNKDDPMDQMSAFLLLWMYELYVHSQQVQNLPAAMQPSPSLSPRWASILTRVKLPTGNMDPLFDILVLQGLLRACSPGQSMQSKPVVEHLETINATHSAVIRSIARSMVHMNDQMLDDALANAIDAFCAKSSTLPQDETKQISLPNVIIIGDCARVVSIEAPAEIGGSIEQRSVLVEFFIAILLACADASSSSSSSSRSAFRILQSLLLMQEAARKDIPAKQNVLALVKKQPDLQSS